CARGSSGTWNLWYFDLW
nr:immunoglobulin heavy chain junction region [Macaca mulatta]MOV35588.1 immunoglobulin heavy chain junction region [Macaca mulatta]MOV35593.1 immunoglobulin heavy chain junction region [Macaca mulatta]MOV35594.1 immunoglobulin heavy chain junction region [Macaca mulatta]MOV35596.1 immunoglobulin heavy chain junction region [Macaca mulatta]